jgi:glycosyltransferase involved in cell wall biosynthesis
MKTTMVIPSYWGREHALGTRETDAVYDHPTPLNEEGTLKRALESLAVLEDRDFSLVVIAVANAEDIAERVEDKVSGIISSVPSDVPTFLFSHSDLGRVHKALEKADGGQFCGLLNLRGYSNVRNLCLFLPHVLGSDIAVLIDDDEAFEDPAFISKAREFIGRKLADEFIGAVAGYYLQPDGDWHVKREKSKWMEHWDKLDRMNEAFERIIGRGPRLKETPFVFGGNMIVHREIFTRIPFDPKVTRGEDIDFLINMRMFGHKFFLDNALSIKHLPPPNSNPIWKQLREDICRFVFERAKLRGQDAAVEGMVPVSAEELSPYPEAFLKDDLEEKIAGACRILADDYRAEGKEADRAETLKNIAIATGNALPAGNAFHQLLTIQKLWEKMMGFCSREEIKKRLAQELTRFP